MTPLENTQKFLDNIKMVGTCWEWQGNINTKGYGTIWIDGTNKKAHRLSYFLFVGETDLPLDHLCRNRPCVNPLHLEPVTNRINSLRGRNFQREKTHCSRGHEFIPQNTYILPKTGERQCRACHRENQTNYMQRKVS